MTAQENSAFPFTGLPTVQLSREFLSMLVDMEEKTAKGRTEPRQRQGTGEEELRQSPARSRTACRRRGRFDVLSGAWRGRENGSTGLMAR